MFHRGFQTLENNKSFFVFGNLGKTLALVFEILLEKIVELTGPGVENMQYTFSEMSKQIQI